MLAKSLMSLTQSAVTFRTLTRYTNHHYLWKMSSVVFRSIHLPSKRTQKSNVGGQSLQDFPRRPKTRKPFGLQVKQQLQSPQDENICFTFATAEEYMFDDLRNILCSLEGCIEVHLPEDITHAYCFKITNKTYLKRNGDGFVYIFREGALSFWNINDQHTKDIMELVKPFQVEPYSAVLIEHENERMDYRFVAGHTKFQKNNFLLCKSNEVEKQVLEMYAFANALVLSVKLAHWEHKLDNVIDSIQILPHELMTGLQPSYKSSKSIMKKIGEVFHIRHKVNLQYSLGEVPDVYWDREELETLFVQTTQFLNIPRRVKIMNEKLSYCAHMVELVKSHLGEQKSIRIELLIVLLILIEVIFEIIHYYATPFYKKVVEVKPTKKP
uniref:Required for meiotic nuclear division protein 1 homolog n=1 Tax=Phallusia mammillata TaxID=59560 RepID=A0A6F9DR02_9ASCI|nr:required for meiotic nuclear division protein 1 homolog [Phallusia mammillata]